MKIARISHPRLSEPSYAVLEGSECRLLAALPIEKLDFTDEVVSASEAKLLAPCTPSKIVAAGANYRGHLEELKLPIPETPHFFIKPPTALIGTGAEIKHPATTSRLEHEAELAIVLKRPLSHASERTAMEAVLGFTCANDVTARDIQFEGGKFLRLAHSKAFDTFCPCGPWIETEIDDPSNLKMQATVNGEVRQNTSTSDMIFPIAHILSYLSSIMTLLPGDLILTGTPSGASVMKIGDRVDVTIEAIGSLSNTIG